jgi:hypothetical protein
MLPTRTNNVIALIHRSEGVPALIMSYSYDLQAAFHDGSERVWGSQALTALRVTICSGIKRDVAVLEKVPSDRTGLLLSRPLRTVRESFQLTQLKPSERLMKRRGDDWEYAGNLAEQGQ